MVNSKASDNEERRDEMIMQQKKSSNDEKLTPFLLKAIAIASLGGILFGYDLGVISGALPLLTEEFFLSRTQQEMVVSFLYIGGGIGAALGGLICDGSGRRMCILLTDIIFVIGAAFLAFANSLTIILIGRIIVGFAVAVSGIADVSYLNEISPIKFRGSIVSINEACISLGFVLSYLAGYILAIQFPNQGWRVMFGVGAIIAIVQFLGMLCMPESPAWLRENGRFEEADVVLSKIEGRSNLETIDIASRGEHDQNHEMYNNSNPSHQIEDRQTMTLPPTKNKDNSSNTLCTHNQSPSGGDGSPKKTTHQDYTNLNSREHNLTPNKRSMSSLSIEDDSHPQRVSICSCCSQIQHQLQKFKISVKSNHRQAKIAIFLSIMSQFCGHPNVLNFGPEIFSQMGFSSRKASLGSTLLVGSLKFLTTSIIIWRIEYVGRRFLLLLGMTIIGVSLLILSISFAGYEDESDDFTTFEKVASMIGVLGVAVGYAMSFGPLNWLIISEMFPTSIRGRALGLSTIITYVSASIVSYTFLSVQSKFGSSIPFSIYFGLTSLSLIYAFVSIPDTGERSPKEIEVEMDTMWWWRRSSYLEESDKLSTVVTTDADII
eukprot:CAMPEP_0184864214 /NCGR_PEP_ID=MMETSP0580-20130426/14136_1 /TAXON_ID=1118495 /ORGANISM="Dactyliosolen fragilissimus" /LENGTH=602 /DNA_ID=CAMNT_0027362907 /DNA_START=112 /DNA_END=1920 /DNA_ORIENTATION=+